MKNTENALAEALSQTGFPFEHHIFQQAAKNGWTTIPNRLYVDAEEEKTREMDLLCYRAEKGPEVTTYTALLISCKARNDKPWVLMTRPWPKQRPAWYSYPPVPVWSNSKALDHEIRQPNWGLEYFDKAALAGLKDWATDSKEEVFALQEFECIKQERFIAKGDSSLYSGVMSLLKALAYEVTALNERRSHDRERLVYQFNLIQMLDGELYEASFGSGKPTVRSIDRYRYFARTMLNGKELSARIDFCTKDALDELLNDHLKVHKFNSSHFNEKRKLFFDGVLDQQSRLDALLSIFEPRMTAAYMMFESHQKKPEPNWISLQYREDEQQLVIYVDCDVFSDKLNANEAFMSYVTKAVNEIYRYDGPIKIDNDIPF